MRPGEGGYCDVGSARSDGAVARGEVTRALAALPRRAGEAGHGDRAGEGIEQASSWLVPHSTAQAAACSSCGAREGVRATGSACDREVCAAEAVAAVLHLRRGSARWALPWLWAQPAHPRGERCRRARHAILARRIFIFIRRHCEGGHVPLTQRGGRSARPDERGTTIYIYTHGYRFRHILHDSAGI